MFASIDHHGLQIRRASFTSGDPITPLLQAWDIDLLLSKDRGDVEAALAAGFAAVMIGVRPSARGENSEAGPLRIAFDGDAVLFDEDCEAIYAREGLQAFLANETACAREPLGAGPFANVLRKLAAVRQARRSAGCCDRIRVALIIARCAPAHARVMRTLRIWNSEVDEAHFVGDGDKGRVLAAFGAHIFFDDQECHIASATGLVATGHVPRCLVPAFDGSGRA